MSVSDGALFLGLALIVCLFLYKEFGKIVKIAASIMIFFLGIGILFIDPTKGIAAYPVMGAGLILLLVGMLKRER